jgi:hypothetical protein
MHVSTAVLEVVAFCQGVRGAIVPNIVFRVVVAGAFVVLGLRRMSSRT